MVVKSSYVLGVAALAICAVFVFTIKHKVQNLAKQLREVRAEIINEKENIHVLNAEYTYLASPNRIKKLSQEKLKLQVINRDQIVDNLKFNKIIKDYEEKLFKKEGDPKTAFDHLPVSEGAL